MSYIENPKLKGSGLLGAIPQTGRCPNNCKDCFFQSGRSFLEPLDENLPNLPNPEEARGRVVRFNDGNDSNVNRDYVMCVASRYEMKFYNTSIPKDLSVFDAPVVLTLNPAGMTDKRFHKLDEIPKNLMFVRFRTNTWNVALLDEAVEYYTAREIPVILTFMAYFEEPIPEDHQKNYIYRKRTINEYWAIKTEAWENIMSRYKYNHWVYSCGKIEGEKGKTGCRWCGNCLREWHACMEKMR